MPYTWKFKLKFANEFKHYPLEQQDKILDFTDIFEMHGLDDFSKYEGKITPSWKGLDDSHPNHTYTKDNHLWHYHVGVPEYKQVHDTYKTSDVVLHFQWQNRGKHVDLVDIYDHYTAEGEFYLPNESYLVPEE